MHFLGRSWAFYALISSHTISGAIFLPLFHDSDVGLYYTNISINGQSLNVSIDTGSYVTWVIGEDTVCHTDIFGWSASSCTEQFGMPLQDLGCAQANGTSSISLDCDGGRIEGNPCHADFGLDDTSLAGQYFVAATNTKAISLFPASGILGLGYGRITPGLAPSNVTTPLGSRPNGSYHGSPTHSSRLQRLKMRDLWPPSAQQAPLLDLIFNSNPNILPYFSLSLARSSLFSSHTPSSWLYLGGSIPLSHPSVNASAFNSAHVPIQKTGLKAGNPHYTAYIIGVSNLIISPPQKLHSTMGDLPPHYFHDGPSLYQIDTGSIQNWLPTVYASYINSLYDPPAWYEHKLWLVDCDAVPPRFGINLHEPSDNRTRTADQPGGQDFYMNAADMSYYDKDLGVCFSAFQDIGATYPYPLSDRVDVVGILGQPFLKNVYLEINRGPNRRQPSDSIYLAAREFYES